MDIKNDINWFWLYLVTDSLQTFADGDRFTTGRLSRRFLYKLELSLGFSIEVSNLLSNEV